MSLFQNVVDYAGRLPDTPLKHWFGFFLKHPKKIVITVTACILAIILLLGWMSAQKVKDVVTKDFNQQQLVLAQHAARQIEYRIDMLKREMSLLAISPAIQYAEKVSIAHRLMITFSSIREEGALEVRYLESGKPRMHVITANGYRREKVVPEDVHYLSWASGEKDPARIFISNISSHPSASFAAEGGKENYLIMKMAIPVRQVSADDAHPVVTKKFSGVLILVVDATALVEKITRDIRSGKTGYAWVIDETGVFLYHPEKEFHGKNAFEARREKKPTISFARINEIQKMMMLKGAEGMSWYISGWHGGKEGEMKKLIAYAPIHFPEPRSAVWSVAVVAPISEVEDALHSIQIQQFSLQAILIFFTLLGGVTIFSLMMNWSRSLEKEVQNKTAEFKKSEQRYKSLVENAEDIIFTIDSDGNYLSINKYGAKLLNRKPDEIIGHNMADVLVCGADSMLAAVYSVFSAKRAKQITHPVKIAGKEYWFNTNFRRLMDKEGNIYAVLGISRDITDRKNIEEHSYHTEKLASMGTLAAGVAHEINNPLAIILGFADLLKEKVPIGSEFYDILKTIENQGMKAKKVVEKLLAFARHKEHREDEVDINKNIEEVLAVVGNNLLLHKIAINKLELSTTLPLVKGDPDELQQVFLNIINNAIYAMKGGGVLTIVTRVINEGNSVEIQISDTGTGISKEHRTRIFDPLYTTKKVSEGTGLGLSVSYGIIARHQGMITFETRTEEESRDTGTTFIITLPTVQKTSRVENVQVRLLL